MIELPHGFLNALLAAIIVAAHVNRSRREIIALVASLNHAASPFRR